MRQTTRARRTPGNTVCSTRGRGGERGRDIAKLVKCRTGTSCLCIHNASLKRKHHWEEKEERIPDYISSSLGGFRAAKDRGGWAAEGRASPIGSEKLGWQVGEVVLVHPARRAKRSAATSRLMVARVALGYSISTSKTAAIRP